ncbi:hypothetical protein [Mycolicibacterium vanbaalenii]|nr:hypothetical protein [Mycolicibacterium vanbaalenii]
MEEVPILPWLTEVLELRRFRHGPDGPAQRPMRWLQRQRYL